MGNQALTAFGANIQKKRKAKNLSQEELGERASLDRTYISGIERGVRNPTITSALRIADALSTTLTELCKGVKS